MFPQFESLITINRAESTQQDKAVVAEMRAREAGQRARMESVRKHSAAEQKNIKVQIQKRLEQAKRELLRIEREGEITRDINESAIWMALKKLDLSLGKKNVKCTDEDDNEVAKFFRWFKFTLKPPYSGASERSLLAIWDTSHWNFFVKFGLRDSLRHLL